MNRDDFVSRVGQESLLAYCIAQNEKFETPRHIELIAEKLEAVERGEVKRLAIFMPPRHGKPYLATEMFPAWYLGRNPNKNVILASYGQSLANDFGRKVRNQIASPVYQEIFKEVELSKDSNSKSQFTLNQGGSYFAVGVGGAITGRGGDLILCDDVVKNADEARSSTYQNNLQEWWETTLYTRLMKDAAVVLVNTRWSDKDLASWILENDVNGEWEVLCLPAISDDGEALWPERYPLSALEVIKREAGTKNFNSLYQQRPSPEEGNVIKREWLKYYRKLPEKLDKIVISVDTSMQESASADNCAITVLARSRASQIVYLLDFHIAKMGFVSALNNIKQMHSRYPRSTIVIENTANGSALIETLKMTTPNVIGVNPKGSKVSRILNIAPSFEAGQIIFPHRDIKMEVDNVIEELVTFPDAKHDDFCDSLSQGVLRLRASGAEMRLNQLIDEYDENGIPFTEKKPETDLRKIFWDHVDWDLEDSM